MKTLTCCLACKKPIRGRSDKKYCDYLCRNEYHNNRNGIESKYLRRVNFILRSNYTILRSFLTTSRLVVEEHDLRRAGFNFEFFTSLEKVPGGRTCYFCYDLGYLPSEKGYFALTSLHERPIHQYQSLS